MSWLSPLEGAGTTEIVRDAGETGRDPIGAVEESSRSRIHGLRFKWLSHLAPRPQRSAGTRSVPKRSCGIDSRAELASSHVDDACGRFNAGNHFEAHRNPRRLTQGGVSCLSSS